MTKWCVSRAIRGSGSDLSSSGTWVEKWPPKAEALFILSSFEFLFLTASVLALLLNVDPTIDRRREQKAEWGMVAKHRVRSRWSKAEMLRWAGGRGMEGAPWSLQAAGESSGG